MKIVKILIFAGICTVIAGLFVLVANIKIFDQKFGVVSPLPSFLTIQNNKQVSTLDIWQPIIEAFFSDSNDVPQISAKSALVYDLTTGKTLYSKKPLEKLPMASLTKIMTSVVAIESKNKEDRYTVTKDALVGEDSMGLSEGEVLTLNELLYGLMLNSGNDAAEVLADNYPKGREQFVKAMNDKAQSLGLKNTYFTNPTGLEGDGDQSTTTYDLLVMTSYAMQYEIFRNVVSTFDYVIPYTDEHKEFYLENQTNLISSYPGVKGVKTGYTPEAGLCLVTYLEYKGHKIIGIILGSDNRREEMKELLDYSLKFQGVTPPPHG